jgi:hypothetical protein
LLVLGLAMTGRLRRLASASAPSPATPIGMRAAR